MSNQRNAECPFTKGNDGFTRLERAKVVISDLDQALKAVQKMKWGMGPSFVKKIGTVEMSIVDLMIAAAQERDAAFREEAEYFGFPKLGNTAARFQIVGRSLNVVTGDMAQAINAALAEYRNGDLRVKILPFEGKTPAEEIRSKVPKYAGLLGGSTDPDGAAVEEERAAFANREGWPFE